MAPDSSASPRMTPVTPASRRRRMPSRSVDAAGDEDVRVVRPARPAEHAGVRPSAAVGEDEPAHAAAGELARRVPRASAAPAGATGTRRAARGAGRGRPPASRRRPRGSREQVAVVDDAHREDDARRAGGEREPDLVGALEAAGDLDRHRDPRRDAPTASRLPGAPGPRAVEVDEVDDPRARPTNRSAIRSGRSVGAPTPADAPGQNTIRERPRSRSIDGITCTCVRRRRGARRARAARAVRGPVARAGAGGGS